VLATAALAATRVVAGFSTGYAVKKLGKAVALTFGVGFVAIQVARHYGVVKDEDLPDLRKWDATIKRTLDLDGDGKVTHKDLNALGNKVLKMLSANVPSATAFSIAFLIGLTYG
jgi:uncharacterized membrane protein (Fun14 family)